MPWSRQFDDPIQGLVTLRDAADYILKLPKSEQSKPHWQAAGEAIIMAAEDRGPILHARVGMLRAMNHGKPDPLVEPGRKTVRQYRIVRWHGAEIDIIEEPSPARSCHTKIEPTAGLYAARLRG